MKKHDFWEQVEQRVEENKVITAGGMPKSWASLMEAVGLHFWKVGVGVSLGLAAGLWHFWYQEVVQIVRVMIWR